MIRIITPTKPTIAQMILGQPCSYRFDTLDTRQQRLLQQSLSVLKELTGTEFDVSRGVISKRVTLSERNGVQSLFATSANYRRPSIHRLIVLLASSDEILLPSERPEDFCRAVRLLQLDRLVDIVAFYALTYQSYGVYCKSEFPRQIVTAEEARQYGFELKAAYGPLSRPHTSFWWQVWGGCFYSFTFDPNPDLPIVEAKRLDMFVGNYRRLPIGEMR
jgi:hypothetical protein